MTIWKQGLWSDWRVPGDPERRPRPCPSPSDRHSSSPLFQMNIPSGTSFLLDEHQTTRIKRRSVRGPVSFPTPPGVRPSRHPPKGPLDILGAGPCFLNLPGKEGLTLRSDDHGESDEGLPSARRSVDERARAARTVVRAPIARSEKNRGGGRGDSSRRRRAATPGRSDVPRSSGHSCFCHSPNRSSPHHEDDDSRRGNSSSNNNNNCTKSDISNVKCTASVALSCRMP